MSSIKSLCVATALAAQISLAGPASAQTPAVGQPQPPAAESQKQPEATQATEEATAPKGKKAAEEEILVTGTRIRRKDLTTPAPITVISREQVQASGKVSIGDFLQTLPEQGNALNTAINNGGSGTTRVALRGLTAARTLVLLNGRRFVPGGTGANDAVDLNSIPGGAIERIEVLKDGASAIYGSDAIGGVINLITRKRMNGAELSAYGATSGHQDGTTYDLNVAAGTSGDRGNALFTAGFFTQKSVMASNRSIASIPFSFDASGLNSGSHSIGRYSQGSGTVPQGTINLASADVGLQNGNALYNELVRKNPGSNKFIRDPTAGDLANGVCVGDRSLGNCWRPYISSSLPADGGDGYNFAPDNYLITPQQRISLFATGDTKFGSNVRGYLEASYVNRQSDRQLAAEPLGTSGEGITVAANNAYNPFGKSFPSLSRRLLEFGFRANKQDIDTTRIVAGVDGTLPDQAGFLRGWYWDTSINYGRVDATDIKTGNLKRSGLAAALGPSFRRADGTFGCGTSAATEIAGCVPLNLFGGPGTIAPDQITNLTFTGNARGTNQMVAAQLNTSGELFNLFGDRPVGLAAGYEYRIVSGEFIPDPVTVAGDTTGNKGDITRGHYYVNEGFAELSVPIVSGMPMAENVELTAAARLFGYSTFGTDYTYKFGARYSPIREFTLRGTYSTGFRAPAIADLYSGQADSFPAVKDPCRGALGGGGPAPASCGAAANNGDNSSQLRSRVGGNPGLQPETAKIYTVGVVLEPSFLRNFTATIDYFNITVDNAIASITASTILSGCYPTDPSKTPTYCDKIFRGADGKITNIIDLQTNVGGDKTAGIDLAFQYGLPPTEFGRFRLIFDGTWLQRFDRLLADGTVIRAKGNYDLGGGASLGSIYPKVKLLTGVTWLYQGLGAGLTGRFISGFKECGDSNGDFAGAGRCYRDATYSRTVDAFTSFDVYLSYNFPTSLGRTSLALGVNNVLDTQPPYIYNAFANTTSPNYQDGLLGRFGYLRASQAF
jgi:outer membrane receptor protein involved in Fe transport